MIKRSLIFVLIAVCSAILVLTGCPTDGGDDGGGGGDQTVTPGGVTIDGTVTTADALAGALMDGSAGLAVIGFDINTQSAFAARTTIPAGKTVVLLNSGATKEEPSKTIAVGDGGLIIEGKLIVSNSTAVSTDTVKKIFIGSKGSVDIQAGGELITDNQKSVSDYVINSTTAASVLTSRVNFAAGSDLTIGTEIFKTVDEIGTIVNHLTAGTVSLYATGSSAKPTRLTLREAQNFTPSQLTRVPGIGAARQLFVTASLPETETALTIPAGALIEAVAAVTTVTTLTVEGGGFVVPTNSFAELTAVTVSGKGFLDVGDSVLPKLTTLTVNGELYAPAATGDSSAGIVITLEGTGTVVELGNIGKISQGSSVGTGADLQAKKFPATSGALTVAPGGKIDGETIAAGGGYEVIETIGTFATGNTYLFKPTTTTVTLSAAAALPAGATFVIPDGITLEASGTGTTTFTVSGAITVKAGGKLTVAAADSITGTGTITAEAGARLEGPGLPSFSTHESNAVNPTGLEIVFVKKDLKDRTTTVTLGGKVTGGIGTWAKNNVWGDKGSSGPGEAADWSWTVLNGIIPPWVSGNVSMEIKQTNPSLVYYKGNSNVTADTSVTPYPLPDGGKDIYFPTNTDNTVKWRQYSKTITGDGKPGAGTPWETDTEYKGFGILLWENATTKRAELVIKYPITGASTTDIVIVDWSGVEF